MELQDVAVLVVDHILQASDLLLQTGHLFMTWCWSLHTETQTVRQDGCEDEAREATGNMKNIIFLIINDLLLHLSSLYILRACSVQQHHYVDCAT